MNVGEVQRPPGGFEGRLEAELVKVVAENGAARQVPARRAGRPQSARPRIAWRRPAVRIGVLAGLAAGAAVALPLVFGSGAPQAPAAGHAGITLAAYTVVRNADGSLTVTINDLRDPQGLERRLAATGVSAKVTVSDQGPFCRRLSSTPWPDREQVLKIFRNNQIGEPAGHAFTFDPAEVPAGATVVVQILRSAHGFGLITGARQTSVPAHWIGCGPDRG
jgi:hypothetical protein